VLSEQAPDTAIVVISSRLDDDLIFSAIRSGVLGILNKTINSKELIEAIKITASGEIYLHPTVEKRLISDLQSNLNQVKKEHSLDLTQREIGVLSLVAKGLTNQEVANHLFITETTLRFHIGNILSKLNLTNRTQAVLYALSEGITHLG